MILLYLQTLYFYSSVLCLNLRISTVRWILLSNGDCTFLPCYVLYFENLTIIPSIKVCIITQIPFTWNKRNVWKYRIITNIQENCFVIQCLIQNWLVSELEHNLENHKWYRLIDLTRIHEYCTFKIYIALFNETVNY